MEVRSTKVQSDLITRFKYGVDSKGKDMVKNQRFSKVKVSGTEEDLFVVGTVIGNLLEYPVVDVTRQDQSIILSE